MVKIKSLDTKHFRVIENKCFILIFFVSVLIFLNHYCFSYSRKIGNTRFYLVETMAISKGGKTLAGLFYKPTATSGYCGENTPGFPKTILWNEKYIVSKNYDGDNPEIVEYVIVNLDSIDSSNGKMTDIRRFQDEKAYKNYLKQINLSEVDMNQTDNHIEWWKVLF